MTPRPRLAGSAAWALALLLAGPALAEPAAARLRPAALAPARGAEGLGPRLAAATMALDRLRGNLDPAEHAAAARQVAELAAAAPEHPRVVALQAWLAMNGHRFAEALALADQALARDPGETVALTLRADALTELGRYDEAVAAVDTLGQFGARLPVLVRAAHLRRLHGDLAGARELVETALGRSAPGHPDRPWLARELATLAWQDGGAEAALALLQPLPGDDPETLVLRARILESAGPAEAARRAWRQAAEAAPVAAAVVGQWRSSRDPAERRRLAHRLTGMARLDEAQGGLARRDFIDFLARDGQGRAALELARREYARRPDVFSAGQLAWVLALAGQPGEAAARAREAGRLGTRDRQLQAWVDLAARPGVALASPPLRDPRP